MNVVTSVPEMIVSALVGLIVVGSATKLGKWITDRATSRRARQHIAEDQELAQQLPEGSTARNHLEASIQERVIVLSYKSVFDSAVASLWVAGLFAGGIIVWAILLMVTSDVPDRVETSLRLITVACLTFLGLELIAVAAAVWDRNALTKRRKEYFATKQYPNIFDVQTGRFGAAVKRLLLRLKRSTQSTDKSVATPTPSESLVTPADETVDAGAGAPSTPVARAE